MIIIIYPVFSDVCSQVSPSFDMPVYNGGGLCHLQRSRDKCFQTPEPLISAAYSRLKQRSERIFGSLSGVFEG